MHSKNLLTAGQPLKNAKKVLILLHGRGASAQDILSITPHLNVQDYAIMAPQATGDSWYPYSFMAPTSQNEPWLSSAIDTVHRVVNDIISEGIPATQIWFAGFSQGACVCLEYVARHARKYGGVAAFTGGLIGAELQLEQYTGNFELTPLYIASGDPDPHVPVSRVFESASLLKKMGAQVTVKIFPGRAHTITSEEIADVNKLVFV